MSRLFPAILILALLALSPHTAVAQSSSDDLDLGAMIQPADTTTFFEQDDYYVWDNSVIYDRQSGKYLLFYARWPKSIGYSSWLTHSQILRAQADRPEGPYTGAEEVWGPNCDSPWGNISQFNVKVLPAGDRYAMYYCATGGAISADTLRRVGARGYGDPLWMPLRNSQRAGVAFADNLLGTWARHGNPVVEPDGTTIRNIANNPTVVAKPGGGYIMMLKGDSPAAGHSHMIQTVAQADRPEGPFRLAPTPAFDSLSTEDSHIWYDNARKRYYSIFHVAGQPYLGLITSTDGTTWTKARNFIVCRKEIPLTDGRTMKIERMERPAVYLENGTPTLLSVAVKNGNRTFICFFKLKNK